MFGSSPSTYKAITRVVSFPERSGNDTTELVLDSSPDVGDESNYTYVMVISFPDPKYEDEAIFVILPGPGLLGLPLAERELHLLHTSYR